jgi:hypothetical protein
MDANDEHTRSFEELLLNVTFLLVVWIVLLVCTASAWSYQCVFETKRCSEAVAPYPWEGSASMSMPFWQGLPQEQQTVPVIKNRRDLNPYRVPGAYNLRIHRNSNGEIVIEDSRNGGYR